MAQIIKRKNGYTVRAYYRYNGQRRSKTQGASKQKKRLKTMLLNWNTES